jgi:linoleoyl-CoA desaturase
VDGCDADIELTTLLKFSASGKWKKMHRYQFMYAPFLYTVYTLYWIFYKDIILFTRKKQANIHFDRHPISEWIKLFLYKIFYLLLMIGLPVILHPQFAMIYGIAFLVMHMINSVFLLFTFLISHHVPHTQAAGENKNSWMMQQVLSSADFHAESKWAYWIFGGFNAHTAHHLFPGISHVHYPGITRIIREHLVANGLPYHSFSFFKGIQWHLILLKETGKEVVRH